MLEVIVTGVGKTRGELVVNEMSMTSLYEEGYHGSHCNKKITWQDKSKNKDGEEDMEKERWFRKDEKLLLVTQ